MHDSYIPHCSFCENFISCFYTDMTTEWGYCTLMLGDSAPTREQTDKLKEEVNAGNWDRLNKLQEKGIIYVPTEVDCGEFVDIYPE